MIKSIILKLDGLVTNFTSQIQNTEYKSSCCTWRGCKEVNVPLGECIQILISNKFYTFYLLVFVYDITLTETFTVRIKHTLLTLLLPARPLTCKASAVFRKVGRSFSPMSVSPQYMNCSMALRSDNLASCIIMMGCLHGLAYNMCATQVN